MKHYNNLSTDALPGEDWRPIPGYDDFYKASNLGRIMRIEGVVVGKNGHPCTYPNRIIKQETQRGYLRVCLCIHHFKKRFFVHRLIALTFIDTVENKPYVNHKDGIRDNNNVDNLEWCDNSDNQIHAYRKLGKINPRPFLGKTGEKCPNSKPVKQLSHAQELIKIWPAVSEAARQMNLQQSSISRAIKNGSTSGGFKWTFA